MVPISSQSYIVQLRGAQIASSSSSAWNVSLGLETRFLFVVFGGAANEFCCTASVQLRDDLNFGPNPRP